MAGGDGVTFDLLHRDERPPPLVTLTDGELPCVVAEGGGEQVVLVDRATLAACAKDRWPSSTRSAPPPS